MADTYMGIVKVCEDPNLRARINACAAQQTITDPEPWTFEHRWEYASAPTWAEKYEYALATGNPDPGGDSAVITDADILTQVQKMIEEDDLQAVPA